MYRYKINKIIFHSKEDDYFVLSLTPMGNYPRNVELDPKGRLVATGVIPFHKEGQVIEIELGNLIRSKNGYSSYPIESFNFNPFLTKEKQDEYLQEIITQNQFRTLDEAYPDENLIELILENKVDLSKLHGIGEATISKIRAKIQETLSYSELISYLQEYGINFKSSIAIGNHFQTPKQAILSLKQDFYNLCYVKGWGFRRVDQIVTQYGIPFSLKSRTTKATEYILQEEANMGHTWAPLSVVLRRVSEITLLPVEKITENIELGEIVDLGSVLALKKYLNYEAMIYKRIKEITKHAHKVDLETIKEKIVTVEKEQGFEFTREQKQAIVNAHTLGISILTGSAGTGKSATIKGIAYTTPDYDYSTMALSGRAVEVLAEKGISSTTLHRGLGISPSNSSVDIEPTMFNVHKQQDVDPMDASVVIIDEVSMLDVEMFYNILSKAHEGTRIVLVGDVEQLPPIGAGDVTRDLLLSNVVPVTQLTKIQRQAQESGIIELAHKFRKGESFTPPTIRNKTGSISHSFGKNKDAYLFVANHSELILSELSSTLLAMKKIGVNINDVHVLAPVKSKGILSVGKLNALVQDIFNPQQTYSSEFRYNNLRLRIGDRIMAVGNKYETPLYNDLLKPTGKDVDIFNGTYGFVHSFDENVVYIHYPKQKGYVAYELNELEQIELAYASTVHRLQGSSAKHILFVVDGASRMLLSKQLLYVGVTRAEHSVLLFAQSNALFMGSRKNATASRRTMLHHLFETYGK